MMELLDKQAVKCRDDIGNLADKHFADYVFIGVTVEGLEYAIRSVGLDEESNSNRSRAIRLIGELESMKQMILSYINDGDQDED